MDLTIDVENYKLNVRAAGIIIHNGKMLVHRNINSDHYALIGGRVEIGEDSANTIKRENTGGINSYVQRKSFIFQTKEIYEG